MENEFLEKLIESYKLSEDEHRMILNELKKRVFLNRLAEKDPSIMFVIGQPGCGKTTFIQNTDLTSYTIINSDDYRWCQILKHIINVIIYYQILFQNVYLVE